MKFLTPLLLALFLITSAAHAASLDAYVEANSSTGSIGFVGDSVKFQNLFIYACGYTASDACRQDNADTVCRRFGFDRSSKWAAMSAYEAHLSEETNIWEPGERGNQIVLNKIKIGALNSPKIFIVLHCAY